MLSLPIVQLITLNQTPEREAIATKQLVKIGLPYQVNRFDKNPVGWKGCMDSHLQVYGRNKDKEIIFVCEDNILTAEQDLSKQDLSKFANLVRFTERCPDWGIVFVGGYISKPWEECKITDYPQVYRTKGNHGTVCYLIHSRLFTELIRLHESGLIDKPIDCFLFQYTTNYIYNPFLFYHSHTINSNISPWLDPFRRLWFHPKMMKVHCLMFFNKTWLYLILLLILVCVWGLWRATRRSTPGTDT